MASERKRILTNDVGCFKKYKVHNGTPTELEKGKKYRLYPWWTPGKYTFKLKGGGHHTMVGGHSYQVTGNGSKSDHEGIRFDHKLDLFSATTASNDNPAAKSSESMITNQMGGYHFIFNNHRNSTDKSASNGFAWAVTTDNESVVGGSPMPVVGLCFRIFADGNGQWKGANGGNHGSGNWTGENSVSRSLDHQIAHMHLVYKTTDTGQIYSKKILPEGNNSGNYTFYNADFSKSKAATPHLRNQNPLPGNNKNAMLVRAWHNESLEKNSVFIGFTVHAYVGERSTVNHVKSFAIGSMSPILKGDLRSMVANKKNISTASVCWEPPCTSTQDAKDRFNPEKNGKKLIIFTDSNNTNTAVPDYEYTRSLSVKNGTAIFKYN